MFLGVNNLSVLLGGGRERFCAFLCERMYVCVCVRVCVCLGAGKGAGVPRLLQPAATSPLFFSVSVGRKPYSGSYSPLLNSKHMVTPPYPSYLSSVLQLYKHWCSLHPTQHTRGGELLKWGEFKNSRYTVELMTLGTM